MPFDMGSLFCSCFLFLRGWRFIPTNVLLDCEWRSARGLFANKSEGRVMQQDHKTLDAAFLPVRRALAADLLRTSKRMLLRRRGT
jgi:hypothetical protein